MEELDYDQREIVLRVDFDEIDHEDCLFVSMRFLGGPRHPRTGETVFLLDGAGNGCMAEVLGVTGWAARVRPDWSTWHSCDGAAPAAASRFAPTG